MAVVERKKEAKGDLKCDFSMRRGKRSYDTAYIKRWMDCSISGSEVSRIEPKEKGQKDWEHFELSCSN